MKIQVLSTIALAITSTMAAPTFLGLLGGKGGLLGGKGGYGGGSPQGECQECQDTSIQTPDTGDVVVTVTADGSAQATASPDAPAPDSQGDSSADPAGGVTVQGSTSGSVSGDNGAAQGSVSGSIDPVSGTQVSGSGSGQVNIPAAGQAGAGQAGAGGAPATKTNNAIPGTGADLQHQNQATGGVFGNGNTYGNKGIGGDVVANIDSITKAIASPIRGILAPKNSKK
ncbi:PGA11 Predicted GPI-anchored protein 11 [Candida maltosa Xu316]